MICSLARLPASAVVSGNIMFDLLSCKYPQICCSLAPCSVLLQASGEGLTCDSPLCWSWRQNQWVPYCARVCAAAQTHPFRTESRGMSREIRLTRVLDNSELELENKKVSGSPANDEQSEEVFFGPQTDVQPIMRKEWRNHHSAVATSHPVYESLN